MRKNDYPLIVLPDIEMYGGDTEPWNVLIAHEDGRNYLYSEITGYSAVLTIMEYRYSVGLGVNGGTYILRKNGTMQRYGVNDAVAAFSFQSSDTINLSGRFTYQIEISYGSDKRIGQGNLFIKNNINK